MNEHVEALYQDACNRLRQASRTGDQTAATAALALADALLAVHGDAVHAYSLRMGSPIEPAVRAA